MTILRGDKELRILEPLPGAIHEEDWSVSMGPASTDLAKREMSVPMILSEENRQIQLREMARAKWTPRSLPKSSEGIDKDILLAAESVRLSMLLNNSGLPQGELSIPDKIAEYVINKGTFRQAVLELVSSLGTGKQDSIGKSYKKRFGGESLDDVIYLCRGLGAAHPGTCTFCGSMVSNNELRCKAHRAMQFEPPFENTEFTARSLQEYIERIETEEKDPGSSEPTPEPPPSLDGKPLASKEEMDMSASTILYFTHGSREWGRMTITEPERVVPLPPELKYRRKVKEETGSVPIAIHRAAIDGRVFRGMRRKRGRGSILIDQSGSMKINHDDIMYIMEKLPGSIIAGYAGNEDHGELRILAKNGKAVDRKDAKIQMGGNVIDGPAVDWLASQPKPRIWVCDGHVSGVGDVVASKKMVEQVRKTMRRAGILRLKNIEAVKEKLKIA